MLRRLVKQLSNQPITNLNSNAMNQRFIDALTEDDIRASIPADVLCDLLICATADDEAGAKLIIEGYLAYRYNMTLDWMYSLLNDPIIIEYKIELPIAIFSINLN